MTYVEYSYIVGYIVPFYRLDESVDHHLARDLDRVS